MSYYSNYNHYEADKRVEEKYLAELRKERAEREEEERRERIEQERIKKEREEKKREREEKRREREKDKREHPWKYIESSDYKKLIKQIDNNESFSLQTKFALKKLVNIAQFSDDEKKAEGACKLLLSNDGQLNGASAEQNPDDGIMIICDGKKYDMSGSENPGKVGKR